MKNKNNVWYGFSIWIIKKFSIKLFFNPSLFAILEKEDERCPNCEQKRDVAKTQKNVIKSSGIATIYIYSQKLKILTNLCVT